MTTYSWNVDADGTWATSIDWSPNGTPTSGSDVTISTPDFHTITYTSTSGTLSINSITVGNDLLKVTGGALTLTMGGTFGQGLSVAGGTLTLGSGSTTSIATNLTTSGAGSSRSARRRDLECCWRQRQSIQLHRRLGRTLDFSGGHLP